MWEENQKKVVFWKPKEAHIVRGGSNSNENYKFTHEFSHVSVTAALGKSCFSEEVRCEMLTSLKSRQRRRRHITGSE